MAARSPRNSRGWRTFRTISSSTSCAQPPRLVQPERRNPDALLPDLGGARVVGAVRGAADVALVRAVDRPEGQPVAIEHRHERGQIGQVVAAVVGVVEQEHVARPDVAAKVVVHRPRRPRQRADVDRHVLGLGDQAPFGVAQRGREIAARVDDLRVRGAQHRLAHLLGDRMQPVADHRDRDRVDAVLRVRRHNRVPGSSWTGARRMQYRRALLTVAIEAERSRRGSGANTVSASISATSAGRANGSGAGSPGVRGRPMRAKKSSRPLSPPGIITQHILSAAWSLVLTNLCR